MNIPEYTEKLTNRLGQKQVRENCKDLINKIIANRNCQLWSLSDNANQYNNFHNMLNGSLKTTVSTDKINLTLLAEQTHYFQSKTYFIIVHDPSPIRKPHTQKSEYLCIVKDLDNKLVNGYMTYNCVAVDLKNSPIHLLRCIPYSTEQPEYVTQEEMRELLKGTMHYKNREKEIKQLQSAGKVFNLKTLVFSSVKAIREQILKENPDAIIIDVFDRGFDDAELFEFETQIGNLYVVRSKLSRNSNELIINEKGKECAVKLKNQLFFESHEKIYNKVSFKDKTYINAKGIFEWNYLEINNKTYSVVRVRFYTSDGKKIFKEPMLLISNIEVCNEELAMLVFEIYMTRSKIEGVFKFC